MQNDIEKDKILNDALQWIIEHLPNSKKLGIKIIFFDRLIFFCLGEINSCICGLP